jgi:hypothetical protein
MAPTMNDGPYWRSPGVVMAGLGTLLMLANAGRAFLNPIGFSAYLGLPLSNMSDTGLVHIYALRALFIGILGGSLLLMRQRTALWSFALAAVIMPVGDAMLTFNAGAPTLTVMRHVAIAVFLLVAGVLLRRDAGRYGSASA